MDINFFWTFALSYILLLGTMTENRLIAVTYKYVFEKHEEYISEIQNATHSYKNYY